MSSSSASSQNTKRKTIPVKTTYFEMHQCPNVEVCAPMPNCIVTKIKNPTTDFYKTLYRSVGKDLLWIDRLMMDEEELRQIIQHSKVDIYVLYVDGKPAGFTEFDRRKSDDVEIVYFGLTPEFIGKGLGKFLLHWSVQKIWEHNPTRLWLHTCELDHKAAIPNYLKSGFKMYKEAIIQQPLPSEDADYFTK